MNVMDKLLLCVFANLCKIHLVNGLTSLPLLWILLPTSGTPKTTDVCEIINAMLYQLRTGSQWRLLPHDFPPEDTVRYYFHRFTRSGLLEQINDDLRCAGKRHDIFWRKPNVKAPTKFGCTPSDEFFYRTLDMISYNVIYLLYRWVKPPGNYLSFLLFFCRFSVAGSWIQYFPQAGAIR